MALERRTREFARLRLTNAASFYATYNDDLSDSYSTVAQAAKWHQISSVTWIHSVEFDPKPRLHVTETPKTSSDQKCTQDRLEPAYFKTVKSRPGGEEFISKLK